MQNSLNNSDTTSVTATSTNSPKRQFLRQNIFKGGLLWIALGIAFGLAFSILGLIIDRTTSDKHPYGWTDYSHEIASAFLGAVVTAAITFCLLKAQTEAQSRSERERENNTKFFEEKMKIYDGLLKDLEGFLEKPDLEDSDFTKLTLTCLHVSYICDRNVLKRLEWFTKDLLSVIRSDSESVDGYDERTEGNEPITHAERKQILGEFSRIAEAIKTDLKRYRVFINREEDNYSSYQDYYVRAEKGRDERLDVTRNIIDNLSQCSIAYTEAERRLKGREENTTTLPQVQREHFLNQCSEAEEVFYQAMWGKLEEKAVETQYNILWAQHGFSLEHMIRFFPQRSVESGFHNVICRPASQTRRMKVEELLRTVLNSPQSFDKKQSITFSWKDMKHTAEAAHAWLNVFSALLDFPPDST